MRLAANPASVASLVLLLVACTSAPPQPTGVPVSPGQSVAPSPSPTSGPDSTDGEATVNPGEPGAETTPPSAPPVADFERAYGEPDPVDVSVELSPITFTTSVTVENGGFMTLPGPDGTFYQLEIPPDAVLSDLDVTMTVVDSIAGSPLGDELVGAVSLEPAGLRFIRPAVLTIQPPVPIDIAEEGPFSSDSDGSGFHLYPLDADPSALRMNLFHFSIFGLFKTDVERRNDLIRKTAPDVDKQLEQKMNELMEDARTENKDKPGEAKDIDRAAAEQVLNYYLDRVLRPMIAFAERDHTLFLKAFQRWASWERQKHLLLGDEFYDARLLESLQRGFANYVQHTKERCYDHDFGAVFDLMALAKENEMMHGILGEFGQGEAFEIIDKCATFTLEMDSTMEVDLNTCMLIDAGRSNVEESAHVTTAVEIRAMTGAPWNGPMRWQSATYEADCRLPAPRTGNLIDCEMSFAGLADAGEFAVVALDVDLNNLNRPPPPAPPGPRPSGSPGASPGGSPGASPGGSPGASPGGSPGASPGTSAVPSSSGPPTPEPTERPEETISELRFRGVLVQPGDPQIFYDGDCSILGFSGGSETRTTGGAWLSGWKDNSAPVGRTFERHPLFGEVYRLKNWEFIGDGDELARLEYEGGTNSLLGTTSEDTTFILRHTPRP